MLGQATDKLLKGEKVEGDLCNEDKILQYIILLIKILGMLTEDDRHKAVITQRIKDIIKLISTPFPALESQIMDVIRAN